MGIVGDVRERLQFDAAPVMYQMPSQIPDRAFALVMNLEHSAILLRTRSGLSPMSVADPVKRALLTVGNMATTKVRTIPYRLRTAAVPVRPSGPFPGFRGTSNANFLRVLR